MKTIVKTIEIYTLDELTPEARSKAIADISTFNAEMFDADYLIEDWKEKLEALGYMKPDISYSGFCSQGDGASFTTENVDLEVWLKAHKLGNKYRLALNEATAENIQMRIYRYGTNYVHERSTSLEVTGYPDRIEAQPQLDEIMPLIEAEMVELNHYIYKDIEADYDEYTNEQSAIDAIEENEYVFLANGEYYA